MKKLILLFAVITFAACTPEQKSGAIAIAGSLAKETVKAVAEHYGGTSAGELASAGLSAAAEVLQGYVEKKPPLQVIERSPGVNGVGTIVVNWLKNKGVVTQATVDKIHTAAQIAANSTATANQGP